MAVQYSKTSDTRLLGLKRKLRQRLEVLCGLVCILLDALRGLNSGSRAANVALTTGHLLHDSWSFV